MLDSEREPERVNRISSYADLSRLEDRLELAETDLGFLVTVALIHDGGQLPDEVIEMYNYAAALVGRLRDVAAVRASYQWN